MNTHIKFEFTHAHQLSIKKHLGFNSTESLEKLTAGENWEPTEIE